MKPTSDARFLLILVLLAVSGAGGGCARVARPLSAAALAAGGGYLGHQLSGGDPAATAGGAAGGALLSEGIFALKRRGERKAYVEGYERGRGDGVKGLYWHLVEQQRFVESTTTTRLVPISLPERMEDGVWVQPSTRYLRVEE
ncbi:MAG: hypothetical protein IT580_16525 [Verrucomicrobiales bacterium]|nr:hypothetical protein [Verrucomicrobiales bacterium]